MKSGVYLIKNLINGKVYVGSAASGVVIRIRWHKRMLRACKHNNRHLQRAWNKYGEESFEFSVLLMCSPDQCLSVEQKFIDQLKAADPQFGYNVNPIAGSNLGTKFGAETRAKSSATKKGIPKSTEHCAKISAAMKGRKKSEEHILKVARALKGKKHTEEHKSKIREGMKRTWQSQEYRNARLKEYVVLPDLSPPKPTRLRGS